MVVKCLWTNRETEYLGYIVGNGIVRVSPKIATIKYWHLMETHKQLSVLLLFVRLIENTLTTLEFVRLH